MTDSNAPSPAEPAKPQSAWEKRVEALERRTVLETLETLGFETDDINELQKDVLFLRRLRKTSETTQARVAIGVVSLIFTVAGALITLAIQYLPQMWNPGQ